MRSDVVLMHQSNHVEIRRLTPLGSPFPGVKLFLTFSPSEAGIMLCSPYSECWECVFSPCLSVLTFGFLLPAYDSSVVLCLGGKCLLHWKTELLFPKGLLTCHVWPWVGHLFIYYTAKNWLWFCLWCFLQHLIYFLAARGWGSRLLHASFRPLRVFPCGISAGPFPRDLLHHVPSQWRSCPIRVFPGFTNNFNQFPS